MSGRPVRQRGLGLVSVIVVLVLLAGMAAAIVSLNGAAQAAAAHELLAARAESAARAGGQWALVQARRGEWTACRDARRTLELGAESGMRVTVRCDSAQYHEGRTADGSARAVRVYTLGAVACNSSSSCPDNQRATAAGYVERHWQVSVSD